MKHIAAKPFTMAISAGVAMALALPGPHLAPLVLLVPGLLRRTIADATPWQAFRRGWVAGFAQWLVAVSWVISVMHTYGRLQLVLAWLGWVLMAAILALLWGISSWLTSLASERWRPLVLPLNLVALELVQHLPPWIFPWNPVAAVATISPWLLQPLPVIGSGGLSLLILLFGAGLDGLFVRRHRLLGACMTAVVLGVFSIAALTAPDFTADGPEVKVAALQPNVPLEVRWDPENRARIEDKVYSLSQRAADAGAYWIVWPESAIPRLLETDGPYRVELERFVRSRNVWLLMGSIGFGRSEGEYYNSAYSLSPAGIGPGRYDKNQLVPFGEYVPLVGALPFLRPLVHEVGAFTPGAKPFVINGPVGGCGVAICYEVAYGSLIAEECELGARVIVTITNDGWYGDTAAPHQHLALAVLRAAESRRFVVRAANTGISAIIDPSGRIVESLAINKLGLITGLVKPTNQLTPAVVFYDWIRGGIITLAAGAIILGAWRRKVDLHGPAYAEAAKRGK